MQWMVSKSRCRPPLKSRSAGEVEVEGDAVVGVGGGIGRGGDKGGVDLMVDVGRDGHAAAHHVGCGEVETDGARTGCGLSIVGLYTAYEGLRLLI